MNMRWKMMKKDNRLVLHNEGGNDLSYHPNTGVQILQSDGYAFKDMNGNGQLDSYEDWRLPLNERIDDFTKRFGLWQCNDTLYYQNGTMKIPEELSLSNLFDEGDDVLELKQLFEQEEALKNRYLLALLLMMCDNNQGGYSEEYVFQLIVQSMDKGVFKNIFYTLKQAIQNFVNSEKLVAA